MRSTWSLSFAIAVAALLLLGFALCAGGAWLVALGGSWYYLAAGLAVLATAACLWRRSAAAWWVFAALLVATLTWSLFEAGLDWWPLAARGDLLFLIGLLLLAPSISRRLDPHRRPGTATSSSQRLRPAPARLALASSLALFLAAGVASWFAAPERIVGTLPAAPASEKTGDTAASPMPAGEWHAYGRTGHGQRYSPLADITPENVDRLEVAWHYRTGDVRGRDGDPEETTFEVTPLKIGEKLFLCTPHQLVIALDATTGKEIWRYDPAIQDELALQHLTCRGLSYHPGSPGGGAEDSPPAGAPADADAPGPTTPPGQLTPQDRKTPHGQPIATAGGRTSARCTARLFMPTADARIIALNPDDGSVCADFGNGTGQIDLWTGMPHVNPGSYYSTSPVVVTESLLIVGGTVLDNVSTTEPSGVIRAYRVDSGELAWAWDPGAPQKTRPLAAGETYTASSPNSWSIASVDEDLGLVYLPLGNQPPDQWGGKRSDPVERFSNSVVALELASGRLRWHFQAVRHDLWDYDVPAQPSLLDLTVNGQTVPALVQPTKQGDIYVLDRRTGEPLLPVTEQPAPQGAAAGDRAAATQPSSALSFSPAPLAGTDMWGATMLDQLACRIALKRLRYEGRFTPPSTQGTLVYPGNFGVFNWGGIAVDPHRQVAFATPTYLAFVSTLVPRDDETSLQVHDEPPQGSLPALNENFGAPFAVDLRPFTSALGLPCQAPPWGYVAGVELGTGKIAWQHKNGTVVDSSPLPLPFRMGVPNLGGPILTAGGIAFLSGTLDYYVRAYDVTTGAQLWEDRLPAGGQATPMTYTGADGRQYLLVVAGGHGSLGTRTGDHVIAYALPSR